MKLRSISWRNIGPYGNNIQTIEFPDHGALWMVTAKNGSGKTFLVNLPKLLYYGKLDKFTKDDIANRFNKHGWIKGEIKSGQDIITSIERNFSPSNLMVEKNGVDIGKAGIGDYQKYIDSEVTNLPYHMFSNIISLSVNDFKSFLSMTPNDKRTIVDRIFSMDIINKMNELVKKDSREIKINIDLYKREIESLEYQINTANKELEILNTKLNEDNTNKINQITLKLEEYKPKLVDAYNKLATYQEKKNSIEKSYRVFVQQKAKLESDLNTIQNKIDLYNSDKCPTCETPFSDSRFTSVKEELMQEHNRILGELDTLKIAEEKYVKGHEIVQIGLTKISEFIVKVRSIYTTLDNELAKLKENKSEEFNSIQKIISEGTEKLRAAQENKTTKDSELDYLDILEKLYSDNGVKRRILESYLPTLNTEIQYTLYELHFPYTLKFDSEFDPHLTHLGIDVNVDTLSTGEKKRVDLAVLISIIRMMKRKYPTLNIFMLDEVLSSIDQDGIFDIIGMLHKTAKEMNMNIFIINHAPLPIEYFSYKIEIDKNNGFSNINVTKLE